MSKILEKIVDITTGEESLVERELTKQESAERAEEQAKLEAQLAEINAAKEAKTLILEKLGITEDEAKLLLS